MSSPQQFALLVLLELLAFIAIQSIQSVRSRSMMQSRHPGILHSSEMTWWTDDEILIANWGKGEGYRVRPARMEAERPRFLSAGEESEAVIEADSPAGGIRAPAKYASLSLPP